MVVDHSLNVLLVLGDRVLLLNCLFFEHLDLNGVTSFESVHVLLERRNLVAETLVFSGEVSDSLVLRLQLLLQIGYLTGVFGVFILAST